VRRSPLPTETLDYTGAELKIVANTFWERKLRIKPAFKEPETVAWIDEHVQEGDVFYDVGANVGGYTLIAASRGATVYAFEPEAMNFGRLVQNMELNLDVADRIFTLPFALWDKHEVLNMYMKQPHPGAAQHAIANGTKMEGYPYRQTIAGIQLDDLQTWSIPLPNHIKLDVDGYEARVLKGGPLVLETPLMKTAMVEIDHRIDGNVDAVMAMMKTGDFLEKDSWRRSAHKPEDKVYNHLFVRHE
jgi:FkbM family methyltransferase